MALVKCNYCGKDISDTRKKCVHCGKKIKSNNNLVEKCDTMKVSTISKKINTDKKEIKEVVSTKEVNSKSISVVPIETKREIDFLKKNEFSNENADNNLFFNIINIIIAIFFLILLFNLKVTDYYTVAKIFMIFMNANKILILLIFSCPLIILISLLNLGKLATILSKIGFFLVIVAEILFYLVLLDTFYQLNINFIIIFLYSTCWLVYLLIYNKNISNFDNDVKKLNKLKNLLDSGILTNEEYIKLKEKILNNICK